MSRNFKVYDEVRVVREAGDSYRVMGMVGTVVRVSSDGVHLCRFPDFKDGHGPGCDQWFILADALVLVGNVIPQRDIPKGSPNLADRPTSVAKHWFIAVLDKDDEKPRPNSPPRLYTSASQARAVARSMAEKNRSETFVVYEATDVVVAPHVVLPETISHKL